MIGKFVMIIRRIGPSLTLASLMLVSLTACSGPTKEQRRQLDSLVGKTEVDVVRTFGVPTRTFMSNKNDESKGASAAPGEAGAVWEAGVEWAVGAGAWMVASLPAITTPSARPRSSCLTDWFGDGPCGAMVADCHHFPGT